MTKTIEAILAAAATATGPMRESSSWERSRWLRTAADLIENDATTFSKVIASEGIKTIREARSEVARAIATLRLSAEEATRLTGETIDFGGDRRAMGRHGWVHLRPMGVVLGITPFNDPLNLVAHKAGPAIAAGNAVVIKPHPRTPTAAKMLIAALVQAGVPNGAGACVEANRVETKAMVQDERIAMVSFTGGRVAGRALAKAAVGKPFTAEMGGVAVTIADADADLSLAVPRLVSGMFAAAGQNCLHVQRILIHEDLRDTLVPELVEATRALRLGDPMNEETDMGDLIDAAAVSRCRDWVAEAMRGGATLLTGGTGEGLSFAPTLIEHPPAVAKIVTKEVFGPITALETFGTLEQAITSSARSGDALAVAIFTRKLEAIKQLSCLRVGQIVVNDSTDFRTDAMPFGGPGSAGQGREGVRHAMRRMTEEQVTCIA